MYFTGHVEEAETALIRIGRFYKGKWLELHDVGEKRGYPVFVYKREDYNKN